ncbi:MAG: FAD-dependent oxidoreductase [Sulfuricella sp.]
MIPGLVEVGYLTNENVFDLTELPRRLLVIGCGPLGCELAQAFCRFGAQTIIAQQIMERTHRGYGVHERGSQQGQLDTLWHRLTDSLLSS